MNRSKVDEVVNAVLYEGYILYPYRPSSTKNKQRFTFGRVYPKAYSADQQGAEPCVMQTECLVQAPPEVTAPTLDVQARFLHPMARDVGRLPAPLPALPDDGEPAFKVVPNIQTNGEIYQTWQEAVERDVPLNALPLDTLAEEPQKTAFSFPASRTLEPIHDGQGQVVGVTVRRQYALKGAVEVTAERLDEEVFKVTVRILNRTPVPDAELEDKDAIVMRTFASTHTTLGMEDGAFVSLMDPPASHKEAADACENDGTWPVLVGDEEAGARDTMLSSPIILYDYPEVASESAGDLFDSTEIDELLTLRIMTMTDEEKQEMRHADERARQILERTENMPQEHLQKMHGAIRGMDLLGEDGNHSPNGRAGEDSFEAKEQLDEIAVNGVSYQPGDRVRLHPKGRGTDIMDLVVDGRMAVIEAVEQDYEDRIHLAVVLEDDPGQDLGMMRQPGHRFFFSPDEVEPL